jgi:uncharacterized membrane protein
MLQTPIVSSVESPRITRSIRIRRPAVALYTAWHHLSQRPTLPFGTGTLHQTEGGPPRIKAPGGHTTGDTFIQDYIHGLFISWKSELASGVSQSGEVWFHADNDGLDSTLSILLTWDVEEHCDRVPPCRFHAHVVQLDQDLHRFKSLMEQ